MSSGAQLYMETVREKLARIAEEQLAAIQQAARLIASAVEQGGLVYLFGTGHSHMLSEEGHYRAGGLAAVCPILAGSLMLHESAIVSTQLERTSGIGAALLARYQPTPRDVLVVFSNSGVNAVPVEVAMAGKALGLSVIGVLASEYSAQAKAGPQGKKLSDVVDIAIDNFGPPGDALVTVNGGALKVGPLSTIAGAFILNAILSEAATLLADSPLEELPFYISANMPGAEAHNARLVERYRTRNPHL